MWSLLVLLEEEEAGWGQNPGLGITWAGWRRGYELEGWGQMGQGGAWAGQEVVGRAWGGARPESPSRSLSPPKSGRDWRLPWRQWRSGAPGLLQLLAPGSSPHSWFGSSGLAFPRYRRVAAPALDARPVDGRRRGGAGSSASGPPAPVLPPFPAGRRALGSEGAGAACTEVSLATEGGLGVRPRSGRRLRAAGGAGWDLGAAGAAPRRYPESREVAAVTESLLPRAVIFFSWGLSKVSA